VCCETSCIQHWTTVAVLWLCARYDHDYSPVTMCNKAEFPQQYGSSVNTCVSDVQFCVKHALCQSAVSITILYRSCYPAPLAPWLYQVLESALCKKYYKSLFLKTFPNGQLRPTCNKWHVTNLCLYVPPAHLSAALTAGGIMGDTINGPDSSVCWT